MKESQALLSERGYEVACKVWSGKDILSIFHDLGITADSVGRLEVHHIALLLICLRICCTNVDNFLFLTETPVRCVREGGACWCGQW